MPLGGRSRSPANTRLANRGDGRLRVAYVMSRFPKLTETFILNEMLAVENAGVDVDIYPLIRQREPLVHAAAVEPARRAHYLPLISPAVLGSQLHYLRRSPRAYLGALATVVRGNLRSRRFLGAGLLLFPKVVHAARLMAAAGTDHVHCHFATHPALAGLVIRRLTGIPFSFTAHGSDIHRDRTMLCRKIAEASFVVAVSQANRAVMAEECGAAAGDTIEVVHCGVDTAAFAPPPARVWQNGALSIVAIGTLHEVKGQRYLIEACAQLRDMGLDFTCRLIGEGPDRSDLEQLTARHRLEDRVTFLGRRTQAEIARLLHEADVLVAPSVPSSSGQREGIPVALMEAMATGMPVVASRLSGIPELVHDGETGFLVEPRDAAGIADALCRLSVDTQRREWMGEQARAVIERDFNVHTSAAQLVSLFNNSKAA